ncbi:hypothetical protein [Deinococcus hopiensis]|uniref:hypothetical protein n=1 Tax=Deinococcus hopiensis TaxID=309885 RepID=UPI001FEA25F1|nr:hypothetical protein [Deinococcus hopiensis]
MVGKNQRKGLDVPYHSLRLIKVSDRTVGTAALILSVDASKDGDIQPVLAANAMTSIGLLVYVNRPLTVAGTQVCQGTLNG